MPYKENRPEKLIYCRIDSLTAVKDYVRGGRCVRFIGIDSTDFSRLRDGGDSVTTYILDIDFWAYVQGETGTALPTSIFPVSALKRKNIDPDRSGVLESWPSAWYRIEVEYVGGSRNYLYRTFSNDAPSYVRINHIERVAEDEAPADTLLTANAWQGNNEYFLERIGSQIPLDFRFDTFHVGQGMCSLVHDRRIGILLDAGAGKPVTRAQYRKRGFTNDLRSATYNLEALDMVVSHVDYDHWKLLAWDETLLEKIDRIFVPLGVNHLVFKDAAISGKCVDTASVVFPLGPQTYLRLIRSDPKTWDSNGDCLVSVFVKGKASVLASGDYVYSRFRRDSEQMIKDLHTERFRAVVVPHHGDAQSARDIVQPDSPDAIAFFSAGTHQYYKHPTRASLAAHKAAGYVVVNDNRQGFIKQVNLL